LLEAAAHGGQFLLTIEPPGANEPLEFRWSTNATEELNESLLAFQCAVSLLSLSKEQGWKLPGIPMQYLSSSQMRTVIAAEALQRGEHVKLPPTSFALTYTSRPGLDEFEKSLLTMVYGYKLEVFLGDELLGDLPAWLMLKNYEWTLEPIVDSSRWKLSCTPTNLSTREYFPPDGDAPNP
jgi:hypothetical protein